MRHCKTSFAVDDNVVSRGKSLDRSAHPGRTEDDRDGQVSWLTGQRIRAAFSGLLPMACWPDARRLQLQGQRENWTRFPFHPRCRGTCRGARLGKCRTAVNDA